MAYNIDIVAQKLGCKRISKRREERAVLEIAPMMVQGMTAKEIAQQCGMSRQMAQKDMELVRAIWNQDFSDEVKTNRRVAQERYELLWGAAYKNLKTAQKENWNVDKAVNACVTVLREKCKLEGVLIDPVFVQNNLQVAGEATADQVLAAFSPMDAGDYNSFIEETGPLTSLPPVPQTEDAPEDAETAINSEAAVIETEPVGLMENTPQSPAPSSGAFKRVRHPLGHR